MSPRPFSAFALMLLLGSAQAGVGTRYEARDPQTCASTKEPKSGAPSAAQATQYFICDTEHEASQMLYLVTNVKVEVAPTGRPFNILTDSMSEIDPAQSVYNIRGGFTHYQCAPVSAYMQNSGKNCSSYDGTKAKGICFKTTFGDWHCMMSDLDALTDYPRQHQNIPPPK
jgi:hypothetical protein